MNRSLDSYEQYSRRNYLLIHGVTEKENEDTDKLVIEFFEKEMEEKLSANDIDPIDLEKNKPEVDRGILSSNLPGTMSVK